jgi:histidine triad (HIT) family protein
MPDCIFCNIIAKNIPSENLYEDDQVAVIKDIFPKAPVHLLVLSKEHIASITDVAPEHQGLLGHMILVAKEQAAKQGVAENGYKLMFNVGEHGGQVVKHIHLHILGGKKLSE